MSFWSFLRLHIQVAFFIMRLPSLIFIKLFLIGTFSLLLLFLQKSTIKAVKFEVESNPPSRTSITPSDLVSVKVTLTREEDEQGLNITYDLIAVPSSNITVASTHPDCPITQTTQGSKVVFCGAQRTLVDTLPGGQPGGISYDPLLTFKVPASAVGGRATVNIKVIFNNDNKTEKNLTLDFQIIATRYTCETDPANVGAKCFSGSTCNDPSYPTLLTGPNAQCGPSQVCCQKKPEEDYDCDRPDVTKINCQQYAACMEPGMEFKCAPSCEYGYYQAPVGGRGCSAGRVCCVRRQVANNSCQANYGSYPYLAECRPYCSDDKPFLVNTAYMANASCPGKNGLPQVCCSATAMTNNILPENLCVYGNFPDGREKLGIKVPFGNGCIPALSDIADFSAYVFYWGGGIAGLVSLILIIYSGFIIMTSRGDVKKAQDGKELINSTITGLVFFIFSAFVLRIILIDILGIIR